MLIVNVVDCVPFRKFFGISILISLPAVIVPEPVSTTSGEIGLTAISISSLIFASPLVSKIIFPAPTCD
ncbi:MAG: hypothetical protein HND39_02070 [Ignavibacteriota bacterium]|nr:hypothetical protein [Ignavibacteriaceae bacterium]QKJ95147.1 MAG: hypothetical protein HND39_02070 [Ignavibacteriota bacterium]